MAVNQSPEYNKAEARYRAATTPDEKLACLEEMLRLVPKHKSSEKLQSQLKQKIKATRLETQQQQKKKSSGHRELFSVPRQGAGQVVLMGAANVGKSAIVGALTDAKVEVAPFPFTTHAAIPGMAYHEDVQIQLVDMPPIIDGNPQPGMMGAYRGADAILLVIDLAAIELIDQYEQPLAALVERKMRAVSTPILEPSEDPDAPFLKKLLVAANKCDTPDAMDNLEGLRELVGTDLKMLPISVESGEGLNTLTAELYDLLHVVRIYPKKPGKPVDKQNPFIVPKGGTVHDLAFLVHRDLAEKLKTARVWGEGVHDGQQVHHTHVLNDKDVVELHF